MTKLPQELHEALARQQGKQLLQVEDPVTHTRYVLVPLEVYQQLQQAIDDDPRAAYPLADEVFREDWDNPQMAEYDHYEDHKR
jgi:hypothetical protein